MPRSWIHLPPQRRALRLLFGAAAVSARRIHDEVFRRLVRCEFLDHSALAADQYSVGHSHNLRQVGRDDHHRFALIGKAIDNFVDFGDRANIYATSQLVQDDDLRA